MEEATVGAVHSKFASTPTGTVPLSGARMYLSSDQEGKSRLTAVTVSDKEGRFEWRIDAPVPQPPYWLIVEHENADRLTTQGFNVARPDYAEPLVVMKLRRKG